VRYRGPLNGGKAASSEDITRALSDAKGDGDSGAPAA
jgi:hypothetical protein